MREMHLGEAGWVPETESGDEGMITRISRMGYQVDLGVRRAALLSE
jgi:hypothetical protein